MSGMWGHEVRVGGEEVVSDRVGGQTTEGGVAERWWGHHRCEG